MLSALLRRPRASSAAALLLPAALALGGCASTPAARAALDGKFDGIQSSLSADLKEGRLTRGAAIGFARAVARGEIERAQGAEGAARLLEMTPCARELDDELADRAGTRDALGALAALMRVDAGSTSADGFSRWARTPATSPDGAWRALGARSLTGSDDAELRRSRIADPDEEVRRSALMAAMATSDLEDTEAVLEAARVDPSSSARAQAIRAAGAIGGERAVLALRDIWPRADEPVREAIVDAWATRNSFNSGGRRELGWVIEHQHGRPAVMAALALVRAGGADSTEALGALERSIKEGSSEVRVRAISRAPFSTPVLRAAMLAAEGDSDEAVAAAAMARRYETPAGDGGPDEKGRAELAERLLKIADGTGPGWLAAVEALARGHEKRVLPALEREAVAKDPKVRIQAGSALALLGELPRAAVVAADAEPRVRVMVACSILKGAK